MIVMCMLLVSYQAGIISGLNFSVLVVCCIWQVFILAFLRELVCFSHLLQVKLNGEQILAGT